MRRGELFINLVFYSGWPLAVIAIILPTTIFFLRDAPLGYELSTLLCWVIGFGLFLKSKISVFRQGRLLSFGSAGMTKLNRFCYLAGYAVMTIALFLSLILYMVFRMKE